MLTNHPRIRLALYLVYLVLLVVAPILAVAFPDYGAAIASAAGVLAVAAGFQIATNLTPPMAEIEEIPIPPDSELSDDDT